MASQVRFNFSFKSIDWLENVDVIFGATSQQESMPHYVNNVMEIFILKKSRKNKVYITQ